MLISPVEKLKKIIDELRGEKSDLQRERESFFHMVTHFIFLISTIILFGNSIADQHISVLHAVCGSSFSKELIQKCFCESSPVDVWYFGAAAHNFQQDS